MEKILGLDLGTNSIGWAIVRHNDDMSYTLLDKGVNIFQDGVAHDKSGEKPMVQERTDARASRRHYFRRRLRKIELLKVLVENDLCPYLSPDELSDWKHHKKYPMRDGFLEWQKTDDISGKNPYRDRMLCLTETLDLSVKSERYILGRALYHIAQRRGFLSNRKDATKESEGAVKQSISSLSEAMKDKGCEYLGEYFYHLYEQGEKIRKAYTSRLEHYKKEFDAICQKQNLDKSLIDKLERVIFFQRPLKSQKGQVGKCTFEKSKSRCPVSHPRFEEFRMWCFVNNIKVKTWVDDDFRPLNEEEVSCILPLFVRKTKPQFDFEDIAKKIAGKGNYASKKGTSEKAYRFNYDLYTSVSGSPVTAGLTSIFGDGWLNAICGQYVLAKAKTQDEILNDVWHALFSYDDDVCLKEWAINRLQLSSDEADAFVKIKVPQGYASLSLNAINKMLPYLRLGYRYDEAVILANLPAVLQSDDDVLLRDVMENILIVMRNPYEKTKSVYQGVSEYLLNCLGIEKLRLSKLYHPSMIEAYQTALPVNGVYQLGSPRTPAVKNPMAMRTLFRLRKLLNELLKEEKIDKDTLIRIEFSRELNDSNMRKAIERYQRELKARHDKYAASIREHRGEDYIPSADDLLKYQLWEEQKHRCPYTSKEIGLTDFLGPNPKFDIEHTVPRSCGGDNSQMNKTLCESRFNKEVKKAMLPTELSNYTEVIGNISDFGWEEKIESLKRQIEKTGGHFATKEEKDKKIQYRHYLKMQLNYLMGKWRRFTMTEIPDGFTNRQGVDVGIIGRYARLYLQTVFKKVSTVKGATTAEFRKMWGLQDYYTSKERISHSHHCVDAITIACIGRNEYDQWAQFMKDEECYHFSSTCKPRFPKPWTTFTEDVKAISDAILVPHYTPSNLSKHTKKRMRVKGKLQYGAGGEVLFVQGDTARCSLHEQTFYGAIKKNDEIKYVVRKSLDTLDPKDVDKIVDDAVREKVKAAVSQKGFKKAVSETIWMNEDLQIPIKKVRIFVPTLTKPIRLKPHRDKSAYEYKRFVNVKNDGNYCMAIYEGHDDRGRVVRSYKLVNNLDAVNYYSGKTGLDNIVPHSDEKDLPLKCILKAGTMVLFYDQSPQELYKCEVEELTRRLYKVTGMSVATITQGEKKYDYGMVTCRYHLEARKSSDLSVKKGEWKDGEVLRPVIEMSHKQFKAFVEGYDFTITTSGKLYLNNVL